MNACTTPIHRKRLIDPAACGVRLGEANAGSEHNERLIRQECAFLIGLKG